MDDGTNSNHSSTKSDSTVWNRPASLRGGQTEIEIPLLRSTVGSQTTVPKLAPEIPNHNWVTNSGYCRACSRCKSFTHATPPSYSSVKKNIVKRIWDRLK